MTDMTDEMLEQLNPNLRTLYAIRRKIYALDEAIIEAIEQGEDATAAHLRARRRVLIDRSDAAEDSERVIEPVTYEEAMAIRDAVAALDRLVARNAAIGEIISAATQIAAMAAGEIRTRA